MDSFNRDYLRQDYLKKYQEWVFFQPNDEESCCNTKHTKYSDCPRLSTWRSYCLARDLYLTKKRPS